jgi:hypothetical protein
MTLNRLPKQPWRYNRKISISFRGAGEIARAC